MGEEDVALEEYLDVCDEKGVPTGKTVKRSIAHAEGICHRTAHVWIVDRKGRRILLQKRSAQKDSYPGYYDTSSAGHVPAGDEPLSSALRELQEELGITALPEELFYIGSFHIAYETEFHGKPFKDSEVAKVFVLEKKVQMEDFVLQKEEIDEVKWFSLREVMEEVQKPRPEREEKFCVPYQSLLLIQKYMQEEGEA